MNIRLKFVLIFVSISLVTLIGASTSSFNTSRQAIYQQVLKQLTSIASIQKHRIDAIVEQNLERINLVSSRTQLRFSLKNYLQSQSPSQQTKMNRILQDAKLSIASFKSIYILSKEGQIIASTNPELLNKLHNNAQSLLSTKKTNNTRQFFLTSQNELMLYLSGPLLLNGEFLGLLVIESKANNIISLVQDYTGLGKTGETLIAHYNSDNEIVYLLPLRFDANAALTRVMPKQAKNAPIQVALDKKQLQTMSGTDYRGKEVLAATEYISSAKWGLVVKADQAEIYHPIQELKQSWFVIISLSGIIILLASLWVANTIYKPIIQLTQVAKLVSKGDLEKRTSISSNDEIGLLAKSFNTMTTTLTNTNIQLENNNSELRKEISNRKRIELALRKSEEKYRQLFEFAQEGIWVLDNNNDTTYVNPAMGQLLGYNIEDMKNRNIYSFMESRGIKIYENNIKEHKKGIKETQDFELLHKSGQRIYATMEIAPLYDDKGDRTGTLAGVINVTERNRAEYELKQYKAHLEELVAVRTTALERANQELESFSYSVSHDLRAPLRAIDGFSKALLEDYMDKLDDQGKNFLNRVRKASQRMGTLIDNLLILSRVSRQDINYRTVDLSIIAKNVIQQLNESEPDRHVKFKCEERMITKGDEHLLQIALNNLISNAWKYTSKKDQSTIQFGETKKEGEITYFIKDNGSGFDMQYREKLFGPFQRLHHSNEFPGNGIGLATVQRIISRHHGIIWADAEVNKGATFYFTLPEQEAI